MKWAIAAAGVIVLFLLAVLLNTEHFTDTDYTNVTQPCYCPTPVDMSTNTVSTACDPQCLVWDNKINALAPTGANNSDYVTVLRAFYSTVYVPSPTRPTEAQVDTFLASSAGTVAGVDVPSVKRIIMDGFHIQPSKTADQRSDQDTNFKPDTGILEATAPSATGYAPPFDEVRTRAEDSYTGANPSPSTRFSEGNYAPLPAPTQPNKPGDWDDPAITWKGSHPAAVSASAENIM
uniref:Uncharacterized protein n=1 Tax=viral metagenome TaxID=1070528 RepID=A0A6C0AJ61_9ZZZZ